MSKPEVEAKVHIWVSGPLVEQIRKLLDLHPAMPATYAVDTALRELKDRLEKEKEGEVRVLEPERARPTAA